MKNKFSKLFSKKNISIVFSVAVFAAILAYGGLRVANAGFWSDLWSGFISPFKVATSTISEERGTQNEERKEEISLYKPAIDYERAVVDAAKRVSPAVVSITVSKNVPIIEQCPYNPFGNLPPQFEQFFGGDDFFFSQPCESGMELREVGSGSGFIISADGMILTNKHVVFDDEASYTVFTNDGKKYDAKVLARDPSQDLAVVKIEPQTAADLIGRQQPMFPVVELGDSDELELGQTAIAIGNALGEFRNTISVGVISGLARNVTAYGPGVTEDIQGVIQTDAAINPGNSGGPLLNLRGEVVGINTAIAQGAQSIGFAIPINRARRAIKSVKTTGEIVVPYLGVQYFMITKEMAEKENLPFDYGARIRGSSANKPAVIPDSPAKKAGLLVEDIILEINGKKLTQENQLGAVISGFGVGDTITMKVFREGEYITLRATLEKRPSDL